MEAGWVRIAGRREVPGRPVIYATTPEFLNHFGLASLKELPGIDELRAAGLLDPVDDEMIEEALERAQEDAEEGESGEGEVSEAETETALDHGEETPDPAD
jgi:segregation and condensation protein B